MYIMIENWMKIRWRLVYDRPDKFIQEKCLNSKKHNGFKVSQTFNILKQLTEILKYLNQVQIMWIL